MSEIQYSPDKPKDCKYCYWYEKRKVHTTGTEVRRDGVKSTPRRTLKVRFSGF